MSNIGNFSILDRGDAPAQIVMERNARSLAQRVVEETREELNKVMSRVHTIYGIMETVEETYTNPSMEYLTDVNELEALLQDEIKKRQYQQQVTVFIVGYQDVCQQKLRLMQQVNEFFMENSKSYDEEEWFPTTPDMDVDEVSTAVEDSLNHAHELTIRLAVLNKEMMNYMVALSEKKANSRGRKKLEKSLQQAKDDVNNLKEKLLILQTDLQEREDKVSSLFKQLEIKNMDLQKFRTAAELGKQKLILTQKELDDKQKSHEETKANFTQFLDSQIRALQESHEQEIDDLKRIYDSKDRQIQTTTADAFSEDHVLERETDSNLSVREQQLKPDSSPPAKATKMLGKTPAAGGKQAASKSPARPKVEHKASSHSNVTKAEKDLADAPTRDHRLEQASSQTQATRPKPQAKNTPGPSTIESYHDVFDLLDEEAWADVDDNHLQGRFAQYRQLTIQRIKELEEQLQLTTAKTHRKVASLKAQFQEHKNKWGTERKLLIEQVDQSLKFQSDAEREADTAMAQLGDFITQQEKLEQEEEVTRTELVRASSSLIPADLKTPIRVPTENSAAPDTPHPSSVAEITPESEHDLQKLMQQTDDAKSHSSIEGVKIEDKREEEARSLSTQSRASLREHYKAKLEEVKLAAESRRSKSPGINLPSQLNLDDELILDDDDDDIEDVNLDDDIDQKDPSMHDVGTSPHSGLKRTSRDTNSLPRGSSQLSKPSRSSTGLIEQPLLIEYLQTYHGVVNFKERVGKIFLEKDLMEAHQMTSNLETLNFDHSKKIMPQIEELTRNVISVLEELSSIISNQLVYDRELPVSSANVYSREPTEKYPNGSFTGPPVAAHDSRNASNSVTSSHLGGVHSRRSSNASEKQLIQGLQDQNNVLKQKLQNDERIHQQQLQRNTVVIEEMQHTISGLQQQLSSLGKAETQPKAALNDKISSPSPESSVMFTRLDSERNAKIMKKAVMEEKLHPEKYKEAVSKMDEYVSLPARRLSNLVKKYIYHMHMKEIEEKVKNSSAMTEEVIHALDKIENLQNQRTRQWAEKMSGMGIERLKLANLLMDTLDTIEQESGIFLIKPMYSYRGRDIKPDHVSKLSRPMRHRHRRMAPYTESGNSFVPAPSPNTNSRQLKHDQNISQQQHQQQAPTITTEVCPTETRVEQESGQYKILGSSMTSNTDLPATTWNIQTTQPWRDQQPNSFNTPKILELDIKRMLIGQNNISSKLPFEPTDDRLTNAGQNTLRSYITIQRSPTSLGAERPTSGLGNTAGLSVQKVGVSKIDQDIPSCLPSSQPLPPITPMPGDELKDQQVLRSPSVASSYKDSHGHTERTTR